MAESIILKDNVYSVPDRPRPDDFRSRTGHALIPESSAVYKELNNIKEYATANDMKLNLRKTKFMLFNQCKSIDFMPALNIDGADIELVEEMRLLGVVLTSDLKFSRNTKYIVERGYKRVWMLRRLKTLGASDHQLVDVYIKQVRSVLELAVPVWHSSLTVADKISIERVQKSALHIILGLEYDSYKSACQLLDLETLEARKKEIVPKIWHQGCQKC